MVASSCPRVCVTLAIAACIFGGCSTSGGADRPYSGAGKTQLSGDCYLSLQWRGVDYISMDDVMKQQNLTPADIDYPAPPTSSPIGQATQPVCGDPSGTTEVVDVYRVPGVPPKLAIMTDSGNPGLRAGADLPEQLRNR